MFGTVPWDILNQYRGVLKTYSFVTQNHTNLSAESLGVIKGNPIFYRPLKVEYSLGLGNFLEAARKRNL